MVSSTVDDDAGRGSGRVDPRLPGLLDLFDHAVICVSPDGRIVHANKHAARLSDRAVAQLVGAMAHELVPATERAELDQLIESACVADESVAIHLPPTLGGAFHGRVTARRWDDEVAIMHFAESSHSLAPLPSSSAVAVHHDDDGSDEERLRLAAIVRSSPDAIVAFDESGTIQFVNPAAVKVLSCGRELRGLNMREILDLPGGWRSAANSSDSISLELSRPDGSPFPVQVVLSHMDVGDVSWYAAIVRDQTHLQSLERKFVEAQRLEAAGSLAAGVAHDFNNILMGISGTLALAERELGAAHPVLDRIVEIRDAVDSAATISQQLLAFTRKSSTGARLFDVDAVTVRMRNLLEATLGDNVRVKYDLRAAGLHVAGDRRHLEQAILNLVINARDGMRGEGQITIATQAIDLHEPLRRYDRTLRAGSYIQVSVTDTGMGIAPENIDRIFEPFFTTKQLGRGTGLGLSMVYGTARSMGGLVEVQSEVGVGTRFEILLPAIVGIDPSLGEQISTSEYMRARARPRTVLIVEDNPLVARTVELYLRADDHVVIRASSLAEAIDLAKASPQIELLLCDAVLPDAFGADVAHALQELLPDIEIVFMSAHPRSSLLDHGRILPGRECLHKPFDAHELRRVMVDTERRATTTRRTNLRVMLVDDHTPSLAALDAVLRDSGFRVSKASSCEEARVSWRSQRVDALVTDVQLPDGSGTDIAREFLADAPGLRVIYMSGLTREIAEEESALPPNVEYLEKPFDIEELCITLHQR